MLRLLLIVVVPLAVIVGGAWVWLTGGRYVATENAYVKNDIIQIAPAVEGRVVEVAVRDHQPVVAGDLLFRIDPDPFRIALARAEAELGSAVNRIEALRAEYRGARLELAEAEEKVAFLSRQAERFGNLAARGAASTVRLDEARYELAAARDRVRVLREKMRQILAALGGDLDIAAEQHPMYREALARRAAAALDLARAAVHAPAAGIVSNMRLQAGEYVETGAAVFTLIATDRPWVEANLKETELTDVRVGQTATIEADAYPGRVWQAVVESISPATGAEFAVLPPQNASGNWVKVVQRLPVRIRILDPTDDPPLRAGMSVRATIDTGRERGLATLVGGGGAAVGRR